MKTTITRFEECTWDRFIDVADDGASVRLAPTFLLFNEMGRDITVEEQITDENHAKVVFNLPPGRPKGAALLWYTLRQNTRDAKKTAYDALRTRIHVNGRPVLHEPDIERMLTGGWDREDIRGGLLAPGRNEFVFSGRGYLRVDPGPGGNSFRSFDAGKTWYADAFGKGRDMSGEYVARLRVKGRPPAGQITSPVIDLADPDDEGRIAPRMKVKRARLERRARTPEGTDVSFEMRSGPTPAFDPACWTPWRRATTLRSPGRFAQWRATLKSGRMEATPVLNSVTLDVDIESDDAGLGQYQALEWDRPKLVRSSYPFTYLTPHARAERLVKQYRLDEVVAAGKTEFERLSLLRSWVTLQWYGWRNAEHPHCPTWDPLDILDTVAGNWGYGMCTHYAAVFVGCAAALGYTARALIIDHHCLAEVWINDLGKWVCMDPGGSIHNDVIYEINGEPANALDIHEAAAAGRGKDVFKRLFPQNRARPLPQYSLRKYCRFAIPLRNNHLAQAEPAEVKHGAAEYHWNGYLWWTDGADPKYPEYSLLTRRRGDLYWTVGRARIYLQALDEDARLLVNLEHTMPNFDRWLVRVNRGEWRCEEAPFEWALEPGDNELQAKAVNVFGRHGLPTRVKVRLG